MKSNEIKSKKSLRPKLRFPDFSDKVDWEEKMLGEIGEIYQPQTISQTDLTSKGFDVYGANGIIGKYHSFNHEFEQIAITCRGSTCGTVNLTNPKSWITGNAMVANVDNNKSVSKKFIFYQLSGANLKYLISGSGQPQITGNIKKHTLSIPTLKEEQQKIADCLSSLDELIEAEDQKLETLQRHKKGLMQELFPSEGQTLPKRRFPEFQSAPEWKEKPLGELIATVTPPKRVQTSQYSLTGLFPIIDQSKTSIAGWTDDNAALINKGFPLIVFGDHTCVLKIALCPFVQGADGIKIFYGSSEISTEYLFQFLHSNPLKMEEYKRHFSILKEKKISYPPRESGEQKRIADFLISIDEIITSQSQKLESLRLHKKGLMQQLFPNAEEAENHNINTNNQNQ